MYIHNSIKTLRRLAIRTIVKFRGALGGLCVHAVTNNTCNYSIRLD